MSFPRYSKYKPSGIEWLGEVPEGWNILPLRWYAQCSSGESISSEEVSLVSGETQTNPVIGGNGLMGYCDKSNVDDPVLVVGRVGALCGNVHCIKGPAWVTDNALILIVKQSVFYHGYLVELLRTRNLNDIASKTAQPLITGTQLRDQRLPCPELSEQQSIADFLDEKTAKIDALVKKKQRLIELLKEKRTALISHAVTKGLDPNAKMKSSSVESFGKIPNHWKEKRFGYLFSFNKGLNITKENLQDEGIPCISYGEIHSKYGFEVNPEKDELKYVSETYIESSKNALLKHGDFIFADTSEDIEGSGNFTYYNSNATAFAGYHTIIAKPASNNESRYLAYLFNSPSFRAQIQKEVTGTKVFSITNSILKDAVVLLPPIPEQQAIVSYLDRETSQIDDLINKIKSAIDKFKEYRTALISAAVTGKIDVRRYDSKGDTCQ